MRTEIRIRDLRSTSSLQKFAEKRVVARLGRFAEELTLVSVRLADVNGPKGGQDKRCHVVVRSPLFPEVSVEALKENPRSAIDSSLERMASAVGRALERNRVRNTRSETIRQAS